MSSIGFLLFCFSLLVNVSFAKTLGNETDRISLIAFKDQISQYSSENVLSSWNNSHHFCKWEGIVCSVQHQRVTKLLMRDLALSGSLSPYIGNLSFLRVIYLSNNSLHGEIPPEIGRLRRLEYLSLANNSFSGNIPLNLSHCRNLIDLELAYNQLSGNIPQELGYFPKLVRLGLWNNNLVGQIPSSIGNVSSMVALSFAQNHLVGSIPDSLSQLTQLSIFSISSNNISGIVPPSLYNLSLLEILSLPENQLRGSLPVDIGLKLPNLRVLYLGGNFFSGPLPITLFTNSSGLQIFDIAFNNFSGEVPIEVGNLRALQFLNLPSNNLGSRGEVNDFEFINSLSNCSNLQYLGLADNHLGGQLPNSIGNLSTNLNNLYLGLNNVFGTIPSDIGKLKNLIGFDAPLNFFTGTIPKSIGMLQNLQYLSLRGNRLSGHIPFSIGNLTSLFFINLANNILEGEVVPSFANCTSLQKFYIGRNHLIGIMPAQVLGSLLELLVIDLAHNNLSGLLPLEVGNLRNLRALDFSDNKLSGEIPNTLGDCSSLEELYLSNNLFHGPIPSSFFQLKVIQFVDLSQNNLSGKLPFNLGNLTHLENLNASFNNFIGEVPVTGIFRNLSAFSVVGNDNLCGGITALHLPPCHIQKNKKKGISFAVKVTLGVLLSLSVLGAFAVVAIISCRKKPSPQPFSSSFGENFLRVSYRDLSDATNGFSPNNLIGTGSYGSVYKGRIREADHFIAVKVMNLLNKGASKSFLTESEVLRKVRHRNLLKILTACSSVDSHGNDFKALIFEFMPNGSLESWLYTSSESLSRNLNLLQTLNIAIDVASALDYLHNQWQTPIVHCDLKPSNVLLDEDMVAHVADFGIAMILHNDSSNLEKSDFSSIAVRGSIGYVPPEYGMGAEVSIQGDVYSYGILLLEMLTGKRPNDTIFVKDTNLHNFCKVNSHDEVMDIIDGRLHSNVCTDTDVQDQIYEMERVKVCLISLIEIGVSCSSASVSERITIQDVLLKMHKIKADFVGIDKN